MWFSSKKRDEAKRLRLIEEERRTSMRRVEMYQGLFKGQKEKHYLDRLISETHNSLHTEVED